MLENPELAHKLEELRNLIATTETMVHMAVKEFDDAVTLEAVKETRDLERLSDLIGTADVTAKGALEMCMQIIRDLYGSSDVKPS